LVCLSYVKRKETWLAFAASLVALSAVGCALLLYRHQSPACKQRGAALAARIQKLSEDARDTLKIGVKKDVVVRFFAENGIPLTFARGEATGTISVTGCAPSGCGTDDAILGLRVKVDKEGSVVSEPVVGGIYTNCL